MTNTTVSTSKRWLIYLLLFMGFTVFYFSTRAVVHTYDAFTYIVDVEEKPLQSLYHPHHLFYGPSGRIAVTVAGWLGYDGLVDTPLQFLNAMAGALGVVFLWRFGALFSKRFWHSLTMAALMGVCYGYWVYASEVEVYTLATMFITLSMWLMARMDTQGITWRHLMLLGVTTAGAVMYHQTNILFVVPVVLFLFAKNGPFQNRIKQIAVYGMTTGIAVGAPYILVAASSDLTTWDRFYDWASGYVQTGRWGDNLSLNSLDALRSGLSQVVSINNGWFALGFYGLAMVGLIYGLVRFIKTETRPEIQAWLVFGLAWLVLYGGFFWWWEPNNIEFWIVLLPLWIFFMLIALRESRNEGLSIALSLIAINLFGLMLGANHDAVRKLTDTSQDYYYGVTHALTLQKDDLVVTRGNILDLYVPYYHQHSHSNVIGLALLNYTSTDYATFVDSVFAQVTQAYNRGQIVYIDQILLDEPRSVDRNPFGLEQADIDLFLERFPVYEAAFYEGRNVFYSVGQRLPVDAREWRFEADLQGWLAYSADNARFEDDGWCFSGGADVWLLNSYLVLDAAQIDTVEIEMFVAEAAGDGQVFWQHENEDFSETRTIHFALKAGRHTYQLDMRGQSGWQGDIVSLRFDPVPDDTFVEACIYRIKVD